MRWFRKAADQGFAPAQYNLGLIYANGRGVPVDYAEAFKWFTGAADKEFALAQSKIGIMYQSGYGVQQD